jgi:hypothetical protein
VNELHKAILVAREQCDHGRWIDAQNYLLQFQGNDLRIKDVQEAQMGIASLYYALMNAGDFTGAALLRWGKTLFNPEPRSVKLIWKSLCDPSKPKVLILGCGSSGKTYSASAWANLNWSRDPEYTSGKIVSTTYGHNKSGIMSRISTFHQNSLFKFPGDPIAQGLQYPGLDKAASILAVAIPEGETGEGRMTGAHPYPRLKSHPVFGDLSRLFVVIDEADQVAEGLWKGIDNILGNVDYSGSIKVIALTNPRDRNNPFAFRAEPKEGWGSVDEEQDEWESREGWHVISIDAAKSENVIQKKSVFPGLMTYEGYMNYVRKGTNDPTYWTYARGRYPKDAVGTFNIFSLSSFDNAIGRLMFEGSVTPVSAIDPAFAEGGNDAIQTIGRFGTAIGFTNDKEEFTRFKRAIKAVQVEQQIPLVKGKTHEMGAAIIQILRSYGVRPEWCAIDKTGSGRGLYDYLAWQYGTVLGIEWGGASTETKILHEDLDTASKRFKGIAAEMWFAANEWVSHGHVKFSPNCEGIYKIRDELCARQWMFHQTFQKLESKKEFISRMKGKSPDRADSFVMLIHPIRVRSQGLPSVMQPLARANNLNLREERSVIDQQPDYLPDHLLGF